MNKMINRYLKMKTIGEYKRYINKVLATNPDMPIKLQTYEYGVVTVIRTVPPEGHRSNEYFIYAVKNEEGYLGELDDFYPDAFIGYIHEQGRIETSAISSIVVGVYTTANDCRLPIYRHDMIELHGDNTLIKVPANSHPTDEDVKGLLKLERVVESGHPVYRWVNATHADRNDFKGYLAFSRNVSFISFQSGRGSIIGGTMVTNNDLYLQVRGIDAINDKFITDIGVYNEYGNFLNPIVDDEYTSAYQTYVKLGYLDIFAFMPNSISPIRTRKRTTLSGTSVFIRNDV